MEVRKWIWVGGQKLWVEVRKWILVQVRKWILVQVRKWI